MERAFLAAPGNAVCSGCGGSARLAVHHVRPFHLWPQLELESTNLVTLCMSPLECHLTLGHGGSFRAWNPHVLSDAAEARAHPERRAGVVERARAGRIA